MKLSDFSSIVQLGVGLHAGSAFLQLVSELASTPLVRRAKRLERLAMERSIDDPNMSDHIDTARDILGDLDIQAISFFRFYGKLIIGNGVVAVILIGLLIWITLDADGPVSIWLAILFCALSTVPFALSHAWFWLDWRTKTVDTAAGLAELEKQVLGVR